MITVSHGGDLGDAVMALPAIRRLARYDETGGRAHLLLHPTNVREPWTKVKVERVKDFFQTQPYIASTHFSKRPAGTNLDKWRRKYQAGVNLADMVSDAFKVSRWDHAQPWAVVDNPTPVAAHVFHRSPRYHGPFCWPDVVRWYGKDAVFVGAQTEHAAFVAEFGFVPYFSTPTLLALARVIAGCTLFVGNQSAPLAIAESLKVPMLVEECPDMLNCRFVRPDVGYGPNWLCFA